MSKVRNVWEVYSITVDQDCIMFLNYLDAKKYADDNGSGGVFESQVDVSDEEYSEMKMGIGIRL